MDSWIWDDSQSGLSPDRLTLSPGVGSVRALVVGVAPMRVVGWLIELRLSGKEV